MSGSDVWNVSLAVLLSLGGGGSIVFALSSWLGKVWATRIMDEERASYASTLEELKNKLNQDTESYKIKLKKSEFIFQKEFEAASRMVAIKQSLLPEHHSAGMDWDDVDVDIANQFPRIEKDLKQFLGVHGAILSEKTKRLVEESIYLSGSNKHYVNVGDPSHEAIIAARNVYENIDRCEGLLIEKVHSQSVT